MPDFLNESEWIILDKLTKIILSNVEGCVVDIGIGTSTLVLSKYAKEFNRKHYSCDVKQSKCDYGRGLGCITYCMKSSNFMKIFPEETVSLVFIDGKHIYETVKAEVYFFLQRLNNGGIIFLHDTYPYKEWVDDRGKRCGNVYKIRRDLEEDVNLQVFTWPYTAANCGLTMVMKKLECYH